MPPTSPVSPEFPCISIVFARTIVHGEDHGVKPFILQLHDGQSTTSGVTIKCTMTRLHSLTSTTDSIFSLGPYPHEAARVLSIIHSHTSTT